MNGLYDIHCHIVPEVDDGSRSLAMSLDLLRKEYADGVRTVVCTPHYRKEMFETPEEVVRDRFFALQKEAAEELPDLRLFLGCEVHRHSDIVDTVKSHESYTMAGSRYVLTEFSGRHPQEKLTRTLFKLRSAGYTPIIAHVERYPAVTEDLDFLAGLVDLGCQVQVNADAVLGKEGFAIKRFCKKLMDQDMIDYIATDCHDPRQRPPRLGEAYAYVAKKKGDAYARRIFIENPARIVQ